MNTLQLVSLAFVLAVLVSLPAPSEGLRSTARWSLLKRIRTIKLNHERLIAAAEAAGMKTTTKACKEIVDSVDEIKQPAKITQDLSPTTSAIQKSKPGQKAMKNKIRKNGFKYFKTCAPKLRLTCSNLSSRCHVSILSKRSLSDEEPLLAREKRANARTVNSSRRQRGGRRKKLHVRVSCNLCRDRCWR